MGIEVVGQGQGPPGAGPRRELRKRARTSPSDCHDWGGIRGPGPLLGRGGGVVEFGTDPPKDC